jgi:hypothetical protein
VTRTTTEEMHIGITWPKMIRKLDAFCNCTAAM